MTSPPLRHHSTYALPGGRCYPSVTAILGVIAKPGLLPWAARQAAEAVLSRPGQFDGVESVVEAVFRRSSRAGAVGTAVHDILKVLRVGHRPGPIGKGVR
jgi:hypothetical protein